MTHGEALALASQSCTFCYGLGMRPGRGGVPATCNCVWRGVFRACYARFRRAAGNAPHLSRVSVHYDAAVRPINRRFVRTTDEDFAADFILLARRTLGRDTLQGRLFRFHFLLGADWKLCGLKLGLNRGEFFHEVYRIQQKLGRVYAETEPYALYPTDEYFGGTVQGAMRRHTESACGVTLSTPAEPMRAEDGRRPLRAPLKDKAMVA